MSLCLCGDTASPRRHFNPVRQLSEHRAPGSIESPCRGDEEEEGEDEDDVAALSQRQRGEDQIDHCNDCSQIPQP